MHGLVLMIQCLNGIFSTKVGNIGQQGKRVLSFIYIWLYYANYLSDSSAMADYRCLFSTSDRHRKLNQLRWQNMSTHLTNETSYWLKKLLMHLNWAIYNVSDIHVCFFPTLSQDRARPIPLAQPEAGPQRSERPVCARSPHRSRNGYPGWIWRYNHAEDTYLVSINSGEWINMPGMYKAFLCNIKSMILTQFMKKMLGFTCSDIDFVGSKWPIMKNVLWSERSNRRQVTHNTW